MSPALQKRDLMVVALVTGLAVLVGVAALAAHLPPLVFVGALVVGFGSHFWLIARVLCAARR